MGSPSGSAGHRRGGPPLRGVGYRAERYTERLAEADDVGLVGSYDCQVPITCPQDTRGLRALGTWTSQLLWFQFLLS